MNDTENGACNTTQKYFLRIGFQRLQKHAGDSTEKNVELSTYLTEPQGIIKICGILLFALIIGCQDNMAVLKKSEELLNAGTPQAAVEELQAFIEMAPEEPKARMLLGKAYNDLGRYNDAVMELQKASQLYAAQPEERIAARLELARTYLKFGDRNSAFRVLRLVQRSTSGSRNLTQNH